MRTEQFTRISNVCCFLWLTGLSLNLSAARVNAEDPLPNTQRLALEGDLAGNMIDAIDRFLLQQLDEARASRLTKWQEQAADSETYESFLRSNRAKLQSMLGVVDERVAFDSPQLLATLKESARIASTPRYDVLRVRWPVIRGIHAEGLLLVPHQQVQADVIFLPDADQSPEQAVGLRAGIAEPSQAARRLAQAGCQVLIPTLISRQREPRNGRARLTHREYLYRSAFELGRHLIGYEVQQVLAAADWMSNAHPNRPLGIIGYGEGGMLALYASALDTRFHTTLVSGYVDRRASIWQQPIDRNVFGLLEHFGDAELIAMVAPRAMIIEAARAPELELPGEGGAPAQLVTPTLDAVRAEVERARGLVGGRDPIQLSVSHDESDNTKCGDALTLTVIQKFLSSLGNTASAQPHSIQNLDPLLPLETHAPLGDSNLRMKRLVQQIDDHNQRLLVESPYVRADFMRELKTRTLAEFQATVQPYREHFRRDIIGDFDFPQTAPNPRTRLRYQESKWIGYDVVLDVHEGIFAYGVLLVPRDLQAGERRPVVVCQHGLEGRPKDTIEGNHRAYHDFAAKLAERGYVVFAPQNIYLFQDRFRTLQRKANPLKKTLFSIMVPQHRQIVRWLGSLDFVDRERIGFYGLSYGGKSAMRIPALVPEYCLSICSADFNDWVWKNASTRSPYSYVWTGEYEIFEFNLGSTFNYAEMATLIAPRPFMVERGHFDGVAPDERVAHEFAKVRFLYQARLGLGDRCEIEWFSGPHTINGKGTFAFLDRHLRWSPKNAEQE